MSPHSYWDQGSVSYWDQGSVSYWDQGSVSYWDQGSLSYWDQGSVSYWDQGSVSSIASKHYTLSDILMSPELHTNYTVKQVSRLSL